MKMKLSPGGENLIAEAVRMANLKPGETLIDIGCGTGETIGILTEKYGLVCTGIDSSEQMTAQVKLKHKGVCSTVAQQEFSALCGGIYDAVLFECVLSTMDDLGGAVRTASALLPDGGCLIIADLCGRNDVTPYGAIDTSELKAICRESGLVTVPGGWQDRTADLDAFAAEVVLGYGSFEAYFNAICSATLGVSSSAAKQSALQNAFCRLDPAGPSPGYFLAVFIKGAA